MPTVLGGMDPEIRLHEAEARYTGTYKATGKPMNAQVCHVWTLKDGKAAKFQQYVDTAKLREVMAV